MRCGYITSMSYTDDKNLNNDNIHSDEKALKWSLSVHDSQGRIQSKACRAGGKPSPFVDIPTAWLRSAMEKSGSGQQRSDVGREDTHKDKIPNADTTALMEQGGSELQQGGSELQQGGSELQQGGSELQQCVIGNDGTHKGKSSAADSHDDVCKNEESYLLVRLKGRVCANVCCSVEECDVGRRSLTLMARLDGGEMCEFMCVCVHVFCIGIHT